MIYTWEIAHSLVILVAEVISILAAPVRKSVFLLAFMSSKMLSEVVGGGKWTSCKFFEVVAWGMYSKGSLRGGIVLIYRSQLGNNNCINSPNLLIYRLQ